MVPLPNDIVSASVDGGIYYNDRNQRSQLNESLEEFSPTIRQNR